MRRRHAHAASARHAARRYGLRRVLRAMRAASGLRFLDIAAPPPRWAIFDAKMRLAFTRASSPRQQKYGDFRSTGRGEPHASFIIACIRLSECLYDARLHISSPTLDAEALATWPPTARCFHDEGIAGRRHNMHHHHHHGRMLHAISPRAIAPREPAMPTRPAVARNAPTHPPTMSADGRRLRRHAAACIFIYIYIQATSDASKFKK